MSWDGKFGSPTCKSTGLSYNHKCKIAHLPISFFIKGNVPSVTSSGPVPSGCLRCICVVESGCRMPNPVCRMDVGSLSCGPYQIKKGYWSDATLKGGSLMGGKFQCFNVSRKKKLNSERKNLRAWIPILTPYSVIWALLWLYLQNGQTHPYIHRLG